MGEIINLRMARKAKGRVQQQAQAQTNRAKFGRTKNEKARDVADADRFARQVDGARRDQP